MATHLKLATHDWHTGPHVPVSPATKIDAHRCVALVILSSSARSSLPDRAARFMRTRSAHRPSRGPAPPWAGHR